MEHGDTAGDTVRAAGVTKDYRLGAVTVRALENVTMSVKSRSFTAIVGPSGSGKTTLLNLVGCIDTVTSGSIEVCGEVPSKFDDDALSDFRNRYIGFIFQHFSLIPVLTAYENVEYPLFKLGVKKDERVERTLGVLKQVGLESMAHRRPNELSGGQRQRVAIARALVKQPRLVIADEPTANLDSVTGKSIIDLMRALREDAGATFIFSSHDPEVIDEMDAVIMLRDGKIDQHKTGGRAT